MTAAAQCLPCAGLEVPLHTVRPVELLARDVADAM